MRRKPIKGGIRGCATCGTIPNEVLDVNKVFWTGGVHFFELNIDNTIYWPDDNLNIIDCDENYKGRTPAQVFEFYKEDLDTCKFAKFKHLTPLHDETWELNIEDRKWYLVGRGNGYA